MISQYKKYSINAELAALLRCCTLSVDNLSDLFVNKIELKNKVKYLLEDRFVWDAISYSNKSLLTKFNDRNSNDDSISVSVAKYLVRMAYRATPFGGFSSLSSITTNGTFFDVTIKERHLMSYHVDICPHDRNAIFDYFFSKAESVDKVKIFSNDTIFIIGDEINYIFISKSGSKNSFLNKSIGYDEFLMGVIEISRNGIFIGDLKKYIMSFGYNSNDVNSFVEELITEQVLTFDYVNEILEDNWLTNVLFRNIVGSKDDTVARSVSTFVDKVESPGFSGILESLSTIVDTFGKGSFNRKSISDSIKLDLYGHDKAGVLGRHITSELENAIPFIVEEAKPNSRLDIFKKNFLNFYENREVPLSVISLELDKLGYLEDKNLSFLEKSFKQEKISSTVNSYTDSIYNTLFDGVEYIDIKDECRPSYKPKVNTKLLAWFSVGADCSGTEYIEIKNLSQQHPRRIISRFLFKLPALKNSVLSSSESDIDYLDIIHLPQDDVLSICSRPNHTGPKLFIRSAGSDENRYTINDLAIFVSNDRVFIRCLRTNKLLNVSMSNSNAYDKVYNLPLYRFLNDLSNQDSIFRAKDLRRLHPQSLYVPGLKFGNIIVSRPSWRFSNEFLDNIKRSKTKKDREQAVLNYIEFNKFPKKFEIASGDNIFPIDVCVDWMLEYFVKQCLKRNEMIVRSLESYGVEASVSDISGKKYRHEILLPLSVSVQDNSNQFVVNTSLLEGEDVTADSILYYKVYCQLKFSNKFLMEMRSFLKKNSDFGNVDFNFVRYKDHLGTHLRLRFRYNLSVSSTFQHSMDCFLYSQQKLKCIHSFIRSRFQPEYERYGGVELYRKIENVFFSDSKFYLEHLEILVCSRPSIFTYCITYIDSVLSRFDYTLEQKLSFSGKACTGFSNEFSNIDKVTPSLNKLLKSISFSYESTLRFEGFDNNFWQLWMAQNSENDPVSLLAADLSVNKPYSIVWSLIHMNFNRVFIGNSRYSEAVIWAAVKRCYQIIYFRN